MTFTIDRFHHVNQQICDLAQKATTLGIRQTYVDTLHMALDHLENHPLDWGDPEYHTKEPGGLVCHGIVGPLFFRFVVYETQKIVIICDIIPSPFSELADP